MCCAVFSCIVMTYSDDLMWYVCAQVHIIIFSFLLCLKLNHILTVKCSACDSPLTTVSSISNTCWPEGLIVDSHITETTFRRWCCACVTTGRPCNEFEVMALCVIVVSITVLLVCCLQHVCHAQSYRILSYAYLTFHCQHMFLARVFIGIEDLIVNQFWFCVYFCTFVSCVKCTRMYRYYW